MADQQATMAVADWVSTIDCNDVPEAAKLLAVDAIGDLVGVALLGTRSTAARILQEYVPAGTSSVWGTPIRTSADSAAMLNGTAAHAFDYDDYTGDIHPSTTIVPALTAIAEIYGASGPEFLAAYVIAFEIESRINRVIDGSQQMSHHLKGWHPTSTVGSLAATIAAARLMELDRPTVCMALGITASLMSGIRANFGTMVKPLHAGLAARNGVMAAILASRGLIADDDVLEGWCGVGEVFGSDGTWQDLDLETLGVSWTIEGPSGLILKAYPSCGATHAAIAAATQLHNRVSRDYVDWPHAVQEVRVETDDKIDRVLRRETPRTGLEAKFSLKYCVARGLMRGDVGMADFSDVEVLSAETRDLMGCITAEQSPEMTERSLVMAARPGFPSRITVQMSDGRLESALVGETPGSPGMRLPVEELHRKFIDCIQAKSQDTAERLWASIRALPGATSVDGLLKLLSPGPAYGAPREPELAGSHGLAIRGEDCADGLSRKLADFLSRVRLPQSQAATGPCNEQELAIGSFVVWPQLFEQGVERRIHRGGHMYFLGDIQC